MPYFAWNTAVFCLLQIMNMSAEETKMLAGHMGHSLNIHVNHYSAQLSILERTKVARILTAVQNGSMKCLNTPTDLSKVRVDDKDVVCKEGKFTPFISPCLIAKHGCSNKYKY